MGGEHGHRGHTDEQGQGQAVQGALHPCKVREEGSQLGLGAQCPRPLLNPTVRRSLALPRWAQSQLAVSLWESHLTSLSLHFFICKNGVINSFGV